MYKKYKIPVYLLLLALAHLVNSPVYGQDSLMISGKITGSKGLPVEGVAVSVEGVSGSPSLSDSLGYFQVFSPRSEAWINIVPIYQYKSRRIYLNNQSTLNIQLTPDELQSGYDDVGNLLGPELRRDIIGSSTSPDLEKLRLYPNQSIDQSFQGNIPGMLATNHSGMPGAGVTSYIRGMRSMYTSNQPLYIVDGLPLETPGLFQSMISGNEYNPMFSIDPMDITNITILKDYSGSAMHGMRGSNGIIYIETLKPTEVQTSIDLSLRTGLSLQADPIPQLNSEQYKTLANEILMSSGLFEEDFRETYSPLYSTSADPEYYKYNKNTNWQEKVFRNALLYDFYMRVRGGDEIAKYGLSVSYLNHQGIFENTNASRFNVRFVGAFNIFHWLRMDISSNLVSNQASLKESALSVQSSPMLTGLFKSPLLHPYQYDEDGNELKTYEEVNSLGISNPLAVINKFQGENKNYRFTTSFKVEADILKDQLKWTSLLGINFNTQTENVFMPNLGMDLYYDDEVYNAAKSLKNYLFALYLDNFLSYTKEFNTRHQFTATAGFRMYKNTFEIDWGIAKNSHERDDYKQLQNGVSYLREMGGESTIWNRMAIYSNVGYSFRNKYSLSANLITEYSSRTGDNASDVLYIGGEPFGVFYSVGGAWRLSNESFLLDQAWLEDFRLRASYGLVGNDDIGNLSSLNYLTVVHYRETSGMIPGTITDQSMKFETNKQLNGGIDFAMFGNRLSLSLDLFSTRTEDLLVFEPQPPYTGFNFIPANNGEILNNGWELGFFSRIIDNPGLKWDLDFNIARFRNSVEAIKDNEVVTPFEGGAFISRVGEPVLSFYGYQYEGVYTTKEEATAANLRTERGDYFGAGDARFTDLSGPDGSPDGIIDIYDRKIIGSPVPDIYGGISSTFRYKRWSLMAYVQYVLGQEVYNYVRFQNERMSDLSNQSTRTLERWTQEGQLTDVPRALWQDPMGNSSFSSRWIEDGSYIRLKHLTLKYTIPKKVWFLRNLEAFVTATNLFTWNKYLGYDPEFSYSFYTMEQGIDYGTMPISRKFMVGVRMGL